jgi:cyclophilin family peptidyl-prolyl cis-trans isomerase
MSKRKTRERQLAKLAARRAAERRKKKRQRILGFVVGGVAAVLVGLVLVLAFTGGSKPKHHAQPSTAPTPTTASPSPTKVTYQPGTGKPTATVTPTPAATEVACGATAPPGAGQAKPQFDGPPPLTIDPANTYYVTMDTSCGKMVFKLDPTTAPYTVNSFVFLANNHFFDGQYFTRLDTSIDVVQGGDPTDTGTGGPGYTIPDELSGKETYPPGTLAMAHSQAPNSGGSQFFIITGPKGHLLDSSNTYTVFGQMTKGLDVAQKIQTLPIVNPQAPQQQDLAGERPTQTIYMNSVTIKTVPGASPTATTSTQPSTSGAPSSKPSGTGKPSPKPSGSGKPSPKPSRSHRPSPKPSHS